MPQIIHFEIIADNTKRAAKFYKEVFGWTAKKWGDMDYWLLDTKKGIKGAITTRIGLFKKKGGLSSYVITIGVDNLNAVAKKIKKAGGKWANEGGLIHGVGLHQYFKDTEGNLFGCLQEDKNAKMPPM